MIQYATLDRTNQNKAKLVTYNIKIGFQQGSGYNEIQVSTIFSSMFFLLIPASPFRSVKSIFIFS